MAISPINSKIMGFIYYSVCKYSWQLKESEIAFQCYFYIFDLGTMLGKLKLEQMRVSHMLFGLGFICTSPVRY